MFQCATVWLYRTANISLIVHKFTRPNTPQVYSTKYSRGQPLTRQSIAHLLPKLNSLTCRFPIIWSFSHTYSKPRVCVKHILNPHSQTGEASNIMWRTPHVKGFGHPSWLWWPPSFKAASVACFHLVCQAYLFHNVKHSVIKSSVVIWILHVF